MYINNGSGVLPTVNNGFGCITGNLSNGEGELNVVNNYSAITGSTLSAFKFSKMTNASTNNTLIDVKNNGNTQINGILTSNDVKTNTITSLNTLASNLQTQITDNLNNQNTINTTQSNTNTNLQNQITGNTNTLNAYGMTTNNKHITANDISTNSGRIFLNKTDTPNTIFSENQLNIGVRNPSNSYYSIVEISNSKGLELKNTGDSVMAKINIDGTITSPTITSLQNQITNNLTTQNGINTTQSTTNTSLQNQITNNLNSQNNINTTQATTNTSLQNQITNNLTNQTTQNNKYNNRLIGVTIMTGSNIELYKIASITNFNGYEFGNFTVSVKSNHSDIYIRGKLSNAGSETIPYITYDENVYFGSNYIINNQNILFYTYNNTNIDIYMYFPTWFTSYITAESNMMTIIPTNTKIDNMTLTVFTPLIKRNMPNSVEVGAYILDYSSGTINKSYHYQPLICSISNVYFPINGPDALLVNPGYKVIIYSDFNVS